MHTLKILFKYTARSRFENFFRGLNSIVDNLSDKDSYHILCSFDVDDPALCNKPTVELLNTYKNISYYYGISKSKIDAINRDLPFAPPFDILICMSDDMVFTQIGFDNLIRGYIPQDLDCFLHLPDGNVDEKLSTLSIVGKTYFERTNYIYNPEYDNVYCDQEETEKSKVLGKYKFVNQRLFDHLHPVFKKADWDAQYKITENVVGYAKDRDTYFRRKRNNFWI